MEMTAAVVFGVLTVISVVLCVRQYRQKGSVMSTAYFAADREMREKLRTKKAYRYAGNVFLYTGLVSALLTAYFLTGLPALVLLTAVLALGGALGGLLQIGVADK